MKKKKPGNTLYYYFLENEIKTFNICYIFHILSLLDKKQVLNYSSAEIGLALQLDIRGFFLFAQCIGLDIPIVQVIHLIEHLLSWTSIVLEWPSIVLAIRWLKHPLAQISIGLNIRWIKHQLAQTSPEISRTSPLSVGHPTLGS